VKIAFIVQRYGREILGGSETLARQLAERLSRRHEITVLTTTAKDYITWKNEFPPGEDKVRGVRVIRFPVTAERDLESFNKFSDEIYKGRPTREQELEWLHRQGPVTPELIEYLKKEQESFDLLVFFTYLYYPTYYGLQVAPEKSVLLPTAHDEPPLKLGIYREMFLLPSSFLFNTEAEELLVLDRFPVHKKMRETIGMGMELLDQPDIHAFRRSHDIPGKYLLYAGRIDAGKGLEELFRYFEFYKEEHPGAGNLQLILIGKLGMKLPENPSIRYIGFVDEGAKLCAMAGAVAVVQPSRLESLSIVTLEAFSVGTPILANAASRVLMDHCRRSNGGLYYDDFEVFEEALTLLLSDRNLARSLGRNGQLYIRDNYGWNKLLPKYELVFRSSSRPPKESRVGRPRSGAPAAAASSEGPLATAAEVETAESPGDEWAPEDAAPEVPETEAVEQETEVGEGSYGMELEAPEYHDPSESASMEADEPDERDEPAEAAEEDEQPEAEWSSTDEEESDYDDEREEPAASLEEPELESELEPEPGLEPEPQEVREEIAHLPSFYRATVPHRPLPPEPPKPPFEATRPIQPIQERPREIEKPKTPDPPLPGEPGLPEFYRPRPRPRPPEEPKDE
jgi:glycosyltransferase involved in cell wall biosynthesis